MSPSPMHDRKGLMLGIGAYALWGVLPLYIHLLRAVPALQLLAHRVLWSLLLLLGVVLLLGRGRAMLAAARGKTLLYLLASTVMIAINWLVYIWAVQNDHVIEASLGYFINPLVNVALGMVVLGERLRRLQGIAIAIAAAGVAIMAASGGALWISLSLAVSFGLYGLLRKVVAIDALGGLTMETLLLAPLCLFWLVQAQRAGDAAWGQSLPLNLMLVLAGIVTATPLLMFAAAARRMAYSTIGLLQYIAPTLQFLIAVLVLGEPLHLAHIITFALIWSGCALYAWDMLRASRDAGAGI
ncbi:EamA family transporter RarD [Sphingomonas sp. LB-2]|uniref:EamA family transporter RarD n=1 Tax=Sphingomonas caeni TaxID=2984949 RepID=UPI002231A46A|nr:EamA family transporter RarD [Sphingomonas caeni]MCW3846992.1 EamA family transporter RarD [Sphingomonas caeni]